MELEGSAKMRDDIVSKWEASRRRILELEDIQRQREEQRFHRLELRYGANLSSSTDRDRLESRANEDRRMLRAEVERCGSSGVS